MNLSELKTLLREHPDHSFQLRLPGGNDVPVSFHVTEVGRVHKTFLDCGGTLREIITCQLQVWVGEDEDHRLEARKMAAILTKAAPLLPDESIPVEIEYEDVVISQYQVDGHEVATHRVILSLAHKHTECLAPELCGLPPINRIPSLEGSSPRVRCGPKGCC